MRREDVWAPVDRLGEALGFLRMTGAFYCQSDLRAPWGISFPQLPGSLYALKTPYRDGTTRVVFEP